MAKQQIAGLHLWEVAVQYRNYFGNSGYTTLWITTPTNSSVKSAQKALKLLQTHRADWPQAKITKIENRGTLDA